MRQPPQQYPSEILSHNLQDKIVDQVQIATLGCHQEGFDPNSCVLEIIRAVEAEIKVIEQQLKRK